MSEIWAQFDEMVAEYPETRETIGIRVEIIHETLLESWVLGLQENQGDALWLDEKAKSFHLLISGECTGCASTEENEPLSFSETFL